MLVQTIAVCGYPYGSLKIDGNGSGRTSRLFSAIKSSDLWATGATYARILSECSQNARMDHSRMWIPIRPGESRWSWLGPNMVIGQRVAGYGKES